MPGPAPVIRSVFPQMRDRSWRAFPEGEKLSVDDATLSGRIAFDGICAQAVGAPARSNRSASGKLSSHSAAIKRMPLVSSASPEHSHAAGACMTSGWIRSSRGIPVASVIMRVFAGPPGINTLAVTPRTVEIMCHDAGICLERCL